MSNIKFDYYPKK